jgi:hypothetical protein
VFKWRPQSRWSARWTHRQFIHCVHASNRSPFPVPTTPDPRAVALLDVERQYVGGPLTLERIALTTVIPIWFVALTWGVRRRSWVRVATVIGLGTLLKVAWLFREAGSNAWLIIPPVALGAAVCACVLLIAYTRVRTRTCWRSRLQASARCLGRSSCTRSSRTAE